MVRTRFAPSPTGDLHLGGVWVALASWAMAAREARANERAAFVLRVEDLDRPRVVAGAEARIVEDLAWLGLRWTEGGPGAIGSSYRQSERDAFYEAALAELGAKGLTYPCDCSRAEIARAASAPHAGEETHYPGTCRDRDPRRSFRRAPAIRLRVQGAGTITFEDGVRGVVTQDLARDVGDFVLRRGDGIFAYQLAVAVDDALMAITDVVRGQDLIDSTPRQIHLMRLLGKAPPRYWHLPLVRDAKGERLAKRTPGATVRDLRARGLSAGDVIGRLAHALGLVETAEPALPEALALRRGAIPWPTEPWRIPEEWSAPPER